MNIRGSIRTFSHRLIDGQSMVGADGIVVLPASRIAYVSIPKSANTTVKAILGRLLTDELGELADEEYPARPFRNRDGRRQLHERGVMIDVQELTHRSDLEVFSVVRHPADRLVSCWADKINGEKARMRGLTPGFARLGGFSIDMPFDKFVERVCSVPDDRAEAHFRSQSAFLVDRRTKRSVASLLLNFEMLPDCLSDFFASRGIAVEVPHFLSSKRQPWQSYYDSSLLAAVSARYRSDLELFGYEL
ncbi:MAG: sulfotransferase family 2 domain-containing protein [Rhodococcus sp. (in: high G+C Gram-positive bacteria)]